MPARSGCTVSSSFSVGINQSVNKARPHQQRLNPGHLGLPVEQRRNPSACRDADRGCNEQYAGYNAHWCAWLQSRASADAKATNQGVPEATPIQSCRSALELLLIL